MVGAVVALAVTAAAMIGGAGTAQAYDGGTCSWYDDRYADKVFQFGIRDWGAADFGDLPHAGGWPIGAAVVCWGGTGPYARDRAAVVGRLFADSWSTVEVKARITFFLDGGTRTTSTTWTLTGALADSRRVTTRAPADAFTSKVRIQLFVNGTSIGSADFTEDQAQYI
jgi:hypothetical protein